MHDNYQVRCALCGRRRGQHYSASENLIFCRYEDLQTLKDTGVVTGGRFITLGPKETHIYKPEIKENSEVVMAVTDKFIHKGRIGIVKWRDHRAAKILWNKNCLYFHQIENISLLKDVKDPNLLFSIKERD